MLPGWLRPLLEIFSALVRWLKDRQLIEAGKREQRAEDLGRQAEVRDAQLKAEHERPRDRDELVDRLRNSGL